jgi:endonuclease III
MLHGQRCCFFKNPACGRCAVLDLCPTGQGRVEGRRVAAVRPESVDFQTSRSRES